jgi:hypothetical protein
MDCRLGIFGASFSLKPQCATKAIGKLARVNRNPKREGLSNTIKPKKTSPSNGGTPYQDGPKAANNFDKTFHIGSIIGACVEHWS